MSRQGANERFGYQKVIQQNNQGRWTNVMNQVGHLTNLIVSYEQVQSNPGSLTPALDDKTISIIYYHQLAEISNSLLAGSYAAWILIPS